MKENSADPIGLGWRRTLILPLLLLTACPSDGGGGGDSGTTMPIVAGPAVLQSISITPSSVSLACGGVKSLLCMGHYDNGYSSPVPAIWTCSTSAASISAGVDATTSTLVSWKAEGSAIVEAEVGLLSASVLVTLGAATPWTLYGIDYYGWPGDGTPGYSSILAYPAGGGDPVIKTTYAPGTGTIAAITIDATGSTIYYQVNSDPDCQIRKIVTATWTDTLVVGIPRDGFTGGFGLDHDSEGYLWMTNGWTGGLVRIDLETGEKQGFGPTPGMRIDLAVGPDNGKVMSPLGFSEPQFLVKRDAAGGDDFYWGSDVLLAGSPDNEGWVTGAGLAFNNLGDCFACGSSSNKVVRYRDLSGNGNCLDDGEVTVFGEAFPEGAHVDGAFGVAVTPDGTVLVNVMAAGWLPWMEGIHYEGIYAFKDLNGDGDALDEDEKTLFSTKSLVPAGNCGVICVGRGW